MSIDFNSKIEYNYFCKKSEKLKTSIVIYSAGGWWQKK